MIEIWIDGACGPVNPGGTGGWGFIAKHNGKVLQSEFGGIPAGPQVSNNVAEYYAFHECLVWLQALQDPPSRNVYIRSDSALVIHQMNGRWRIKEGRYVIMARRCRELLETAKLDYNVTLQWIPRDANEEADELSKRALKEIGEVAHEY